MVKILQIQQILYVYLVIDPKHSYIFINSSLIECESTATPRMEDHDVIFQFTPNMVDYYSFDSNNLSINWHFYPPSRVHYFQPSFMEIGFQMILLFMVYGLKIIQISNVLFDPEEITQGTYLFRQ